MAPGMTGVLGLCSVTPRSFRDLWDPRVHPVADFNSGNMAICAVTGLFWTLTEPDFWLLPALVNSS